MLLGKSHFYYLKWALSILWRVFLCYCLQEANQFQRRFDKSSGQARCQNGVLWWGLEHITSNERSYEKGKSIDRCSPRSPENKIWSHKTPKCMHAPSVAL